MYVLLWDWLHVVSDNDRYWHPFKADILCVMLRLQFKCDLNMYMNKMILTKYIIVPQKTSTKQEDKKL